jgi:hypothetical protein
MFMGIRFFMAVIAIDVLVGRPRPSLLRQCIG